MDESSHVLAPPQHCSLSSILPRTLWPGSGIASFGTNGAWPESFRTTCWFRITGCRWPFKPPLAFVDRPSVFGTVECAGDDGIGCGSLLLDWEPEVKNGYCGVKSLCACDIGIITSDGRRKAKWGKSWACMWRLSITFASVWRFGDEAVSIFSFHDFTLPGRKETEQHGIAWFASCTT